MTLFENCGNSSSRMATSLAAISSRRPRLPRGLVRLLSRRIARSCHEGSIAGTDATVSRTISSALLVSPGCNIDFFLDSDDLAPFHSKDAQAAIVLRKLPDPRQGRTQSGADQESVDYSM